MRRLNDLHMTPEQIVDELRRKIMDETGMPASAFPGYVNVTMRASVIGILAYLKRRAKAWRSATA